MIAKQSPANLAAPIKWHGGKTYLATRILGYIPEHVHYVEPFFGGGAVLLRKPDCLIEGHSEVVNDLYGDLVTFWKVLQSAELFPEFQRRVEMTPLSKPIWESCKTSVSQDPVDSAYAFFVRYRQSRQGLGKDFATMSRSRTRRGMNEQVSSWLSAVDGLPEAHARLSRVAIYCEPAADIIAREDDDQTFFYCDPPYMVETRSAKSAYTFEMSDEQHVELLETLGEIKGKFILSGYPSETYNNAASKYNWNRIDISIDNKASSQKVKPKKTECLWMNF
ncbi:DNA adenine methylase [Planctomicrobium sp. SH527]|uniref:DNA adenine methylase n=1 Tax=Planctomicrobium sp. SH527 TaxID=3448123 RepID=UPI003F5C514C